MQILVPPSLLKMMPSPWHLGTSTIISSSSESCGSYRVKGIPDGSVERYKARLVANSSAAWDKILGNILKEGRDS